MRGERALDAVQRTTGHCEVFGRDTVGGQHPARVLGQFGQRRRLPVKHRAGACAPMSLRDSRDGQQGGVGVAGGQIADAGGDVEPEQ